MLPNKVIEQQLQAAVRAVLPDAETSNILVRPCPDPKFGDYQSNSMMALAKARKLNPRQLATDVVSRLQLGDWCEPVEIAGAGFLNFRLRADAVGRVLAAVTRGEQSFVEPAAHPRTVVVDFSSPNVAKPMHVGHIRSTILGDALARLLRLLGHRVITDNHIGDWGTQFGMLLVGWKTLLNREQLNADPLAEMERLYKQVSARCNPERPEFDQATLDLARAELVKLQASDAENLSIWREMIRLSQVQFENIYGRLGVKFDHTLGESFYNDRLSGVVQELMQRGIAAESRGAKAVLSDGSLPPKEDPFLVQRDGEWTANPFIIQKQDGGFNYASTDLATLAYRLETWRADEVIYVTDGRQQLHFRQLFASFGRWHPEHRIKLAHVWFGSILGEDGKPFKTRSGETVRLAELLDEAVERALKLVNEINPEMDAGQRRVVAEVVALGGVKYADLLPNRQSDYVFSWDKMLALNGNSAPYLQYAYARTRSVRRKAAETGSNPPAGPLAQLPLEAPEELALAKHLLNFGLMLEGAAEEYRPNFICNYLYDLAGLFARFWENCAVLKGTPDQRTSRLALCDLCGQVLKQGLNVLGIEVLEQM